MSSSEPSILIFQRILPLLCQDRKRVEPASANNAPQGIERSLMRILCKKTDTLVGYLYQWNNGDLQPAWRDTAKAEVRNEPISAAA